jgi:lipopolysaccharide/colanic/teichoic acid biosynthesis glycosyltransferase
LRGGAGVPATLRRGPSLKRLLDSAVAGVGLVLLAPLLLVLALVIRLGSPGPVFYRGERVGLGGITFRILKFRTMVVEAEKSGGSSTPEDDPRITRVGHMLRRWKLDEAPQLINVVRGEMSLVGPRPQVRWAVDLYTPEERRLLSVRPGITDWASVRFRNEAEILRGSDDPDRLYLEKIAPEKIRLGLWYVDNQTFLEDLRIIFATLRCVITR